MKRRRVWLAGEVGCGAEAGLRRPLQEGEEVTVDQSIEKPLVGVVWPRP